MGIYLAQKNSSSKILLSKENAHLIKDGHKIVIFKTQDEIEALLLMANDYYGDVINRECLGEKTTDELGRKTRNKPLNSKKYIGSGIINLNNSKKEVLRKTKITEIADKRYSIPGISKKEIEEITLEVKNMLNCILK